MVVPRCHKKPFHEMTLDELREEEAFWEQKIANATGWGAALGAANEFLHDARRQIRRKESMMQDPTFGKLS